MANGSLTDTQSSIDRLNSALLAVDGQINTLASGGAKSFQKINTQVRVLSQGVEGLYQCLAPMLSLQQQFNQLAGAQLDDTELLALQDRVIDLADTYGQASTDILSATDDIQNVLDQLNGAQFAAFEQSAVHMAKTYQANMKSISKQTRATMGQLTKQYLLTGVSLNAGFDHLDITHLMQQMDTLTSSDFKINIKPPADPATGIKKWHDKIVKALTLGNINKDTAASAVGLTESIFGIGASVFSAQKGISEFGESMEKLGFTKWGKKLKDFKLATFAATKAQKIWNIAVKAGKIVSKGFGTVLKGFGTGLKGFGTGLKGFGTVLKGFGTVLKGFGTGLNGIKWAAFSIRALACRAGMLLFNGAIAVANVLAGVFGITLNTALLPITLIIGAILLLGLVIYELITHWDSVCDAFANSSFMQTIKQMVDRVKGFFSGLGHSIMNIFRNIKNYIIDKINSLINGVNKHAGWLGVHIDPIAKDKDETTKKAMPEPVIKRHTIATPRGGLTQSVSQSISNKTQNQIGGDVHIGQIVTQQPAETIVNELNMGGCG